MERTGAPDIFSLLRIYRLLWGGHVRRLEDGRLPKEILCSAVARVSEAPPEISRGAPHTLLAYYYELQ